MKWTEIDLNQINVKERKRGGKALSYSSLENAIRFQIPKTFSNGLVYSYDKYYLDVVVPEDFEAWWKKLEDYLDPGMKSSIRDDKLRIRVDVHTEIFDENSKMKFEELKEGYLAGEVTVIVEVESVYDLGSHTGVSVRAHQIKHGSECLL